MEHEPERKSPRKWPAIISFLIAGVGLFLLAAAVDLLALHQAGMGAGVLIVAGLAMVYLAVLWAKDRT